MVELGADRRKLPVSGISMKMLQLKPKQKLKISNTKRKSFSSLLVDLFAVVCIATTPRTKPIKKVTRLVYQRRCRLQRLAVQGPTSRSWGPKHLQNQQWHKMLVYASGGWWLV